jgi:hypothetical protein
MTPETESYREFTGSLFDSEEEVLSEASKVVTRNKEPRPVKPSNVAAWRKIEDFWDDYKLRKQISDDPFPEDGTDYY